MIAHERGFKFHVQPQTGAYSCSVLCWQCLLQSAGSVEGNERVDELKYEFNSLIEEISEVTEALIL